ncbi:MAG: hypothetical protein JKX91_12485 [Rhizobiaceae bacterium]|nr:hypothetical protein [Rhizobiaceae bacterium]
MLKLYFFLLVGSGFFSLIFSIEDVAILAVIYTGGLALPLWYSSTVFMYLVAIYPLTKLGRSFQKNIGMVVLTAISLAIVTVGPWVVSYVQESKIRLVSTTFVKPMDRTTRPRTLEIRRPVNFNERFGNLVFEEATCGLICRALIKNGEVDWIRVFILEPKLRPGYSFSLTSKTLFVAGKSREECEVPGGSKPIVYPCVLIRPDHGKPAGLIVQIDEKSSTRADGTSIIGWRKLTAKRPDEGGDDLVFNQEEHHIMRYVVPTIIRPRFSGMHSKGYEVARYEVQLNPIDYRKMYKSIGYNVLEQPGAPKFKILDKKRNWKTEPTDQQIRDVISVLDSPNDKPFNAVQVKVVNNWLLGANYYSDWTDERMEIIRRILHDSRIGNNGATSQIFKKPAVSKALFGEALNLLLNGDENVMRGPVRSFVFSMLVMKKELVASHRELMVRILREKPYGKHYNVLLYTAAWAGENPTPFFDKLEGQRAERTRIFSLCLVTPLGQDSTLTGLRERLKRWNYFVKDTKMVSPTVNIEHTLQGLYLQGEADYVEKFVLEDSG